MAAITIVVFSLKGGSGKTVTALSLYSAFVNKGVSKVALLDMDKQQSLINIDTNFPKLNLKVYEASKAKEAIRDNTLLIVDTPPYYDAATIEILKASNIIVLTCKPYIVDALRLKDAIQVIQQNKLQSKARILITQLMTGSKYGNDVKGIISGYGIGVLNTSLNHRISYAKSVAKNIYKLGDKKAVTEVENLSNEIYTIITLPK